MKAHLQASLEIAHQHLMTREFDALLAAREQLTTPTAQQRVAQCSGPLDVDDEFFTLIWRTLASSQPELFGPRLRDLSEEARGASLAYLYEQTQCPELHHTPDLALIADDLDSALEAFCFYSANVGCPEGHILRDIGLDFNVEQMAGPSVLGLLMRDRDWAAISLFCEPALRRTILLDPLRRWPRSANSLPRSASQNGRTRWPRCPSFSIWSMRVSSSS
jgi:hypothetical protein